MREVVLDTETTGFDPQNGDRIVEIGAVELLNHLPTGKTYHQYINPERSMPKDAFEVHGIGPDLLDPPQPIKSGSVTLGDKPLFKDIGKEFLDFVAGAKLVIHNAAFDVKFLNAELRWINLPQIPGPQAIDTLAIARSKYPGSPASLDALCRRFGIDNSNRALHGALLDSEILAEVYLELIGGRQPDLVLGSSPQSKNAAKEKQEWRPLQRSVPLGSRLTEAEKSAHITFVDSMGSNALWLKDE